MLLFDDALRHLARERMVGGFLGVRTRGALRRVLRPRHFDHFVTHAALRRYKCTGIQTRDVAVASHDLAG